VADPQERVELSFHPGYQGIKARMGARFAELLKTAFVPDRGSIDPRACEVGLTKYGGFWGPFAFL
jgi:hypothetical protein